MSERQADRILRYLLANPGAAHLELMAVLRIANVNARISDLRAAGHAIETTRDARGVYRYRVVIRPTQLTITGAEEPLSA